MSARAAARWTPAPGLAWGLLAALLASSAVLVSATVAPPSSADWDWQPALAARQPWRWWSAALVHWSPLHLQMNLGGCALLGWLGWRAGLPSRSALAWAVAWPLTQLGLWLQPGLQHYGGLSGVLHAGVAVLGLELALHRSARRERSIGALILAGLLLKLLSEQPWQGPLGTVPGWDFPVAPGAHLGGTVAGLLTHLIMIRSTAGTRPRPVAQASARPEAPV